MPGAPLLSRERDEIHAALTEDHEVPWAVVGRRVGRHPTTVMGDVEANGGRNGYRPAAAERRAGRCRRRPRERLLAVPGELRTRVHRELRLGRSPVAIVLDLDAEGTVDRPCAETIYRAVYDGTLEVKPRDCLRMRRPRRRSRTARNPSNRPALPNILNRPAAINDRTEPAIGRSIRSSAPATGRR
jgi:IS30 family transposase